MTKYNYLVAGSEGSGTYMLTEALVAAGCHYCDAHPIGSQLRDRFIDMEKPFVFRVSFPHAGMWPELKNIVSNMGGIWEGDRTIMPHLLYIVRDPYATWKSVERRDPDRYFGELYFSSFISQQRRALSCVAEIAGWTMGFTILTYESFCLSPGFRKWLFEERLDLTNPVDFEIKYANDKYYPKDTK